MAEVEENSADVEKANVITFILIIIIIMWGKNPNIINIIQHCHDHQNQERQRIKFKKNQARQYQYLCEAKAARSETQAEVKISVMVMVMVMVIRPMNLEARKTSYLSQIGLKDKADLKQKSD